MVDIVVNCGEIVAKWIRNVIVVNTSIAIDKDNKYRLPSGKLT